MPIYAFNKVELSDELWKKCWDIQIVYFFTQFYTKIDSQDEFPFDSNYGISVAFNYILIQRILLYIIYININYYSNFC